MTGPDVVERKVVHWKVPVALAPPDEFDYRVIITWPAPHPGGALPGPLVSVHDADSGDQIFSVTQLALYVSADGLIWARAEMLLGKDGKPAGGEKDPGVLGDDGEPVTGKFALLVTEMRIAPPAEPKSINALRAEFDLPYDGPIPAGPST